MTMTEPRILRCAECGYVWASKNPTPPKQCPDCGSRRWDGKPRRRPGRPRRDGNGTPT